MGAGISLAVLKAMERGINHAALSAGMPVAVTHGHDMLEAGGFVREPHEEVRTVSLRVIRFLSMSII
jgi:hypothetical protein